MNRWPVPTRQLVVGAPGGGESGLGLLLGNWFGVTLLEQGWGLDQMTSRDPFQPQVFWDSGAGPNSAFSIYALRKCPPSRNGE